MSRRLALAAIIYALALGGMASLRGELLALAIPFALYLGAGLLRQPGQVKLSAERWLGSERIQQGELVEVRLLVRNQGAPIRELALEDQLPAGAELVSGSARLLAACPSGAELELSYTLRPRRGAVAFSGLEARAREPLGLAQQQLHIPAPGSLLVLPAAPRLRQVPIQPRRTRPQAGQIPARQGGSGIEFYGVRPYQPGDTPRSINSRASARDQQSLYVNEFEQERVADVGIILDARSSGDVWVGSESLFDHSVRAAAGLAEHFLGRGNRVGLLIYGQTLNWTFPGYGKQQRERLLRALALAAPGEHAVFEQMDALPTRLFPSRSQLVLISTLTPQDGEMLARLRGRGYGLLVVSPSPSAFERRRLPRNQASDLAGRVAGIERTLLLRGLVQSGISVVHWDVDQPLQQALDVALRGR